MSLVVVRNAMPLKIFGKQASRETPAEVPPHTFLGVMFVNHSVQTALWKVEQDDIHILSQSSLIPFENDEDGLIKTDQALQELGPGSENISEVVFGFDPQWVENAGLVKEKKPFIKNLTDNLGLKPVGFVVVTDALVQHAIAQESLVSEVLMYAQHDTIFLALLKQGKLVHQLSVGRSEDIVQDIVEGLARLSSELTGKDTYLPAKLVLVSSVLTPQELDDAQQQIASYNWSENHPFVQTPVVETLLAADVLQAVVKQGGLAVAEAKGLKGVHSGTTLNDPALATAAEDFGFEDKSFTPESSDNLQPADLEEPSESPIAKEAGIATSFGVPISSDELPSVPEETPAELEEMLGTKRRLKLPPFLQKLYRWYDTHPHKKVILIGGLSGVLAVIASLIGWTVLSYRVAVSIQLTERVITKDVAITVDPAVASSNATAQILKATLETTQVEGRESVSTSGVTLVGERAEGTITIFNKSTAPKLFTAGTIVSAESVTFSLDEDVTVASASVEENSSGTGETKDYGRADVPVTAREIGANGNLGQGTELSVADFSSSTYTATAKEAFSGGSSREVRVVSQEDQERALEQLRTKLLEEARQEFSDKSGDGVYYLPTSVARTVQARYDNEVGKEAEQVTLDLTLEVSAAMYRSEDIWPLLEAALQDDIPEGYQLVDEEPEFLSSPRDEATASTRVVLDTNVRVKARPPFDERTIREAVLGAPLQGIVGKLEERPEVEQAAYMLEPGLARFFVSAAPQDINRVRVEVTNDQ